MTTSTAPERGQAPPGLAEPRDYRPRWGWGRWAWRRLTSMRTAVILLSLLAVAAVPGSVLPQRNVASDPQAVVRYFVQHPELAPWMDRLSLFNVYGSPWFAAIYLLLLVSMTGCVLPRCARLWRESRAAPPPAPRHLSREPEYASLTTAEPADQALETAAAALRRRRFRVRVVGDEVRAEKGYLRETGNLAFHLSLLVLLVGIAGGRLYGFEGRVAVAEGSSFTNVSAEYDEFFPSVWTDVEGLEPLSFTLDSFEAEFETDPAKLGEPRSFDARVSYESEEGSGVVQVKPNSPLDINETKFFLTGHGYAPEVTVRDGTGAVTFSGPVIFLPSDSNFTSDGVVKAPDAQPVGLGFQGLFLPTAATDGRGPVSAFPGPVDPQLVMTAFTGDLGMSDGTTQSVYTLDTTNLEPVLGEDGSPLRQPLAVGETMRLPDDQGSLTFDGVSRFANFQVAYDPGKEISLVAALLLLGGLTTSLVIRRRRLWVRVTDTAPAEGLVAVEVAMRSLTRRQLPAGDLEAVSLALRGHDTPPPSPSTQTHTQEPNR